MPADQETIRYTGVYGTDADGAPYLMREVLGGGSGGRWYADGEDTIHVVPDSRNIPVEFAESRWPFIVERLGWRSTPAGRAGTGAGWATTSTSGCCATRTSCPSRTARCWPAGGSGAAGPGSRSAWSSIRAGPNERTVDALADARAGTRRRGDPDPDHRRRWLGRPAGAPVRGGADGRARGARCRRGAAATAMRLRHDGDRRGGTDWCRRGTRWRDLRRRCGRAARRAASAPADEPFFDRGPGYRLLSGGRTYAEVDFV